MFAFFATLFQTKRLVHTTQEKLKIQQPHQTEIHRRIIKRTSAFCHFNMAALDLKVLVKGYCKTYQSKRNAKTQKDDNHHDFLNFNRELWNYFFFRAVSLIFALRTAFRFL